MVSVFGVTEPTDGAGAAVYVKWSPEPVDEMPLGVTTVTSTVPAA